MIDPIDTTTAQSNRWFASIEGLPSIEYKLVDFSIPMITSGVTELGGKFDVSLVVPGDRMSIDEIQLNFLVDKRYINYYHVYKWLRNNLNAVEPLFKDIDVMMLDNQGLPQGVTFHYIQCYPIMIAPVQLDSEGATTDIVVGLTLKVSDFDISITGVTDVDDPAYLDVVTAA